MCLHSCVLPAHCTPRPASCIGYHTPTTPSTSTMVRISLSCPCVYKRTHSHTGTLIRAHTHTHSIRASSHEQKRCSRRGKRRKACNAGCQVTYCSTLLPESRASHLIARVPAQGNMPGGLDNRNSTPLPDQVFRTLQWPSHDASNNSAPMRNFLVVLFPEVKFNHRDREQTLGGS